VASFLGLRNYNRFEIEETVGRVIHEKLRMEQQPSSQRSGADIPMMLRIDPLFPVLWPEMFRSLLLKKRKRGSKLQDLGQTRQCTACGLEGSGEDLGTPLQVWISSSAQLA